MFADAHCDTLTRILDEGEALYQNSGHVDMKRLLEAGCVMQFFAIWIDPKYEPDQAFARVDSVLRNFQTEFEKNQDFIQIIRTPEDIDAQKLGVVLAIEGGGALEGRLENLQAFYDRGIRAMTLTWNGRNQLGDGCLTENPGGLTSFGKQVVREMNRLGMIIDVSHLSEQGFWDVAEHSVQPFFATHSNARALRDYPRNLTDDQIRFLIKNNGFIGLNFCPYFVREEDACSIPDLLQHAEHILSLGGEDILGLGADFDGVDSLPDGISSVADMNKVVEEFCKIGYSDALINKILYGNLQNGVKRILKK